VVERAALADDLEERPGERLDELGTRLAPADHPAEEETHRDRGGEDQREGAEQVLVLAPWGRDLGHVVAELLQQLRRIEGGALTLAVERRLDRRGGRVADAQAPGLPFRRC